ncbi:MAG: hypothetical protein Q8Q42_03190 [Nanoarchaeota archaeon]|nr:hypothetical protein [Nanoarchaeota archaeon]
MHGKRGQAGIEYVILTGLLLFFFIPLIHYSLQESNNAIKNSQLDSYVNRLAKSIDAVHSIGPGSSEIVIITVPKGVTESSFSDCSFEGINEFVLKVGMYGGISDVHASVKPCLYGELPITHGTYHLKVLSINETAINISWGS